MNMQSRNFETEIEFTLPKGYLDQTGILHRRGVMRLATAADEILPLRDPRVQQNEAYLAIIVLARVITRLGDLPSIDTKIVEGFYAYDLNYLQRLYEQINGGDDLDLSKDIVVGSAAMEQTALSKGFQTVGEA